jgi:hypothetical protein
MAQRNIRKAGAGPFELKGRCGSATPRNLLSVSCVPFAAPCDANISVPFGENRRSDSVGQRPRCAHKGHWRHESE